jgi:type 2 lantibiotic biosynthesis protein LanM
MDDFFERFAIRAATIDELLSDAFEVSPGQKADADVAARRLAAWCRSCASGDWTLFSRRLARDGLTLDQVLPRLATARRNPDFPLPFWVSDAQWIEAALRSPVNDRTIELLHSAGEPQAFEHLLAPVVESAQNLLWPRLPESAASNLTETGISSLGYSLAQRLSDLCAPALYKCFVSSMAEDAEGSAAPAADLTDASSARYNQFVAEMRDTGLRRLFETKPILLRLIASVTRQWIETTQEFLTRLHGDLPSIREQLLCTRAQSLVSYVAGGLGDRHNFGRSVQLVRFADGSKILYKPKDLRIDALWASVVERLNASAPPIDLRAARVLAGEGYGWSEFIDHTECSSRGGFESFFRRAGAWLCLFHIFVGTDMHEENMIAAGNHPVPIDLETILQAAETEGETAIAETFAFELARRRIANSVIMTGLLPSYTRSPQNMVLGHGGLLNHQNQTTGRSWENINTDAMKRVQNREMEIGLKNLPCFDGEQARLGEFIDALVAGYGAYAVFLSRYRTSTGGCELFDAFAGLPTRKVLRQTRFYFLLLERLKDHRNMTDGAEWSAHLDFVARLMDWNTTVDPLWPLLKAERAALAELNVPHFVSRTDSDEIADASGILTRIGVQPGLDRARARFAKFDSDEVAWQCEVVRLSTKTVLRSDDSRGRAAGLVPSLRLTTPNAPDPAMFAERAAEISRDLSALAIRSGPGAAWIGLDWLGGSGVCQPSPLGADLYDGAPGICVFLAAYGKVAGDEAAARLSLAGISALRHHLRSVNAARVARELGIGGASGMGSVVYAFTVVSELLKDKELLADAAEAASLFTSDLIATDKSFDVIAGSAGGILGLLKLYRATGDRDVLDRAAQCGDHLVTHRRSRTKGERTWLGWGVGRPLNGMSHGAAGFAYALTSLAAATGRNEFARTARECIEFENTSFSPPHDNWPDFRTEGTGTGPSWSCQWCHGAGGIGLARIGMLRQWPMGPADDPTVNDWRDELRTDIRRAVDCVKQAWPYPSDTLCCGNLGNIELLNEAAQCFAGQAGSNLRDVASRRMMMIVTAADARGDYLWVGGRRFNLSLFTGLAGVGYTLLRQVDRGLPNVLLWE